MPSARQVRDVTGRNRGRFCIIADLTCGHEEADRAAIGDGVQRTGSWPTGL